MRGSWILRTVFSIKPQNGSKNFPKSPFFADLEQVSIFETQNVILKIILTCLSRYLSQIWIFWSRNFQSSSVIHHLYFNNKEVGNKSEKKVWKISEKISYFFFFAIFCFKIMNLRGIHEIDAWKKSWICEDHELWNHEMRGPPV